MMKNFLTGLTLLCTGFLLISAIDSRILPDGDPAQPIIIAITAEPDSPSFGDMFDLVLYTDDAAGIFYIEAEIGISPRDFELTGLQPGNLFGSDALFVGDFTAANRIGFSVASIGEDLSGSGSLFVLNFQVSENASAASHNLSILNFRALDKDGNDLQVIVPATVQVNVRSYISWASFHSPETVSLEYGFSAETQARIIVPDVTSVSGQSADIEAWIGISSISEAPWQWPENAWFEAEYVQRSLNSHVYRRSFGSNLLAGTYYLASRFRYQDDDFVYGGYSQEGGGFWDGSTNVSGTLIVNEPGLMVVAEWNFNDDSMIASRGIYANTGNIFSLVGANHTGFITGSPGRAATSNGWNGSDPDLEKYWLTAFSTSELRDLKLSYKMKSSGTGPRDFMLQSSLDGITWTDLLDEPFQITDNFNHTNIVDFYLPESLENQENVSLRWLLASDTRVNESEDPITSTGSSQIDEVKITGRPLQAQFPPVWPGDTNNDGVVNETDVLPIGFYWRSSGPARAVQGHAWQESAAVGWIPLNATFADTDGSGTVNHSDLLAVGLNFGKVAVETPPENQPDAILSAGVAEIFKFPAIEEGKMLEIDILSEEDLEILGVSYSYTIHSDNESTVLESSVDFRTSLPGNWTGSDIDQDRLLLFQKNSDRRVSGAVVSKGSIKTTKTNHLVTLRIAATTHWPDPISLGEFKLNYIGPDGIISNAGKIRTAYRVVTATGMEDVFVSDMPSDYRLVQNYPNPFNPVTRIQFELPESGAVRLDVFSVTGQHVATLVDDFIQSGYHSAEFDASLLASGVYIYRLQAGQVVLTNKMTLIK